MVAQREERLSCGAPKKGSYEKTGTVEPTTGQAPLGTTSRTYAHSGGNLAVLTDTEKQEYTAWLRQWAT